MVILISKRKLGYMFAFLFPSNLNFSFSVSTLDSPSETHVLW